MELQKFMISSVLILGFLSTVAQSIRFEIESGRTKCISEDIKSNSMTVGHYSVVNPNEGQPLPESHKLTLRVTSVYGNSYHYANHVQSGQFAFQAVEVGDYMACFFAIDHHPAIKIPVEFDWRSGMAAKDWSNLAKKGSVDAMELELKKLADAVTSIHEEMFYLQEREHDMQELNRVPSGRSPAVSSSSGGGSVIEMADASLLKKNRSYAPLSTEDPGTSSFELRNKIAPLMCLCGRKSDVCISDFIAWRKTKSARMIPISM